MIAKLGTWVIKTNLSKHLGSAALRIRVFRVAPTELSPTAVELEQEAGDFIARHVLERDSDIFEG